MIVEAIRILAKDLGLQDEINELIRMKRYSDGDYAFRQKTKEAHKLKYLVMWKKQQTIISKRLEVVLPEYSGFKWSYGRLSENVCYVTIWNPEWES